MIASLLITPLNDAYFLRVDDCIIGLYISSPDQAEAAAELECVWAGAGDVESDSTEKLLIAGRDSVRIRIQECQGGSCPEVPTSTLCTLTYSAQLSIHATPV